MPEEQNGLEQVIAYASRSLHPGKRNDADFSSFKLELLAMKWAIVKNFKDHLWGARITAVTDNTPATLGAVEQRFVAQFASFD